MFLGRPRDYLIEPGECRAGFLGVAAFQRKQRSRNMNAHIARMLTA